jgi:hypothetical protein
VSDYCLTPSDIMASFKLHVEKIMIIFALYNINTMFIVLAHWIKRSMVGMFLHSHIISWILANQSLFLVVVGLTQTRREHMISHSRRIFQPLQYWCDWYTFLFLNWRIITIKKKYEYILIRLNTSKSCDVENISNEIISPIRCLNILILRRARRYQRGNQNP